MLDFYDHLETFQDDFNSGQINADNLPDPDDEKDFTGFTRIIETQRVRVEAWDFGDE